jgi:hypothetical protein
MAFTRTIRGETFRNTSLILAGIRFESCTFILCQLIYDGDEAFAFDNCTFFECEWTFDGPAENTLVFLSALYDGLGEEGQQLVESVFNSIREGKVKDHVIPLIPREQLKTAALA